jgi:octaprenyl-diphosphate synthase
MRPHEKEVISEVYEHLREELIEVEDTLRAQLVSDNKEIAPIIEFILGLSGKRLRPILVLLSSQACGYKGEKAISLATAVELIHTATLIHDDVIDEAKLRRFIPTLNVRWGDNLSIIAGDYLYSKSFSVLSENFDSQILKVLAYATNKICEGEMEQLKRSYDPNITREQYLKIVANKTGALISGACQAGGMLGGNQLEGEIKALGKFGLNLGIAYQIMDDCLDLIGQEDSLGKETGNDLSHGKLTLPIIYAMDHAKKEGLIITDPFEKDKDYLLSLADRFDTIQSSIQTAKGFINLAKAALYTFKGKKVLSLFEAVSDYVLERQNPVEKIPSLAYSI